MQKHLTAPPSDAADPTPSAAAITGDDVVSDPTLGSSAPVTPPAIGSGARFPMRLHKMLESDDLSSIISWTRDGTAFKVHDKARFTKEVLPVYFGTSKYKSFQRNLNLWDYKTISKGPYKGECSHPLFKKGFPRLCKSMERLPIKKNQREGQDAINKEQDGADSSQKQHQPCVELAPSVSGIAGGVGATAPSLLSAPGGMPGLLVAQVGQNVGFSPANNGMHSQSMSLAANFVAQHQRLLLAAGGAQTPQHQMQMLRLLAIRQQQQNQKQQQMCAAQMLSPSSFGSMNQQSTAAAILSMQHVANQQQQQQQGLMARHMMAMTKEAAIRELLNTSSVAKTRN